jgi:hypothetical protein
MTKKTHTKHIWFRISRGFSILALSAVVAVAAVFSIAGSLTDEPWRANFAFALLVMSLFTALAVVMSYGASPRVMQVARAAWTAIAVACLVFTQYILHSPASDAQTAASSALLFTMLILAFPAGIVAIGFAFVYSTLILPDRGVRSLDLIVLWSAFAAIGYLQWFKLFPILIEKWRLRKRGSKRE